MQHCCTSCQSALVVPAAAGRCCAPAQRRAEHVEAMWRASSRLTLIAKALSCLESTCKHKHASVSAAHLCGSPVCSCRAAAAYCCTRCILCRLNTAAVALSQAYARYVTCGISCCVPCRTSGSTSFSHAHSHPPKMLSRICKPAEQQETTRLSGHRTVLDRLHSPKVAHVQE